MSGLNKAMLIGNLGTDPEVRRTADGRAIANLRLATSKSWKDRTTGERKEKTEWHRVVVYADGLVGVVERYMKKGMKLYVEGELQTREWEDQQGQKRYTTEVAVQSFGGVVEMLSEPRDRDERPPRGGGEPFDDAIPFAPEVRG